jgi:hypothetical protein
MENNEEQMMDFNLPKREFSFIFADPKFVHQSQNFFFPLDSLAEEFYKL